MGKLVIEIMSAWFVLSVVIGILIGKVIAYGDRQLEQEIRTDKDVHYGFLA